MRNTLPFVTLTANGSCKMLQIEEREKNIGKENFVSSFSTLQRYGIRCSQAENNNKNI